MPWDTRDADRKDARLIAGVDDMTDAMEDVVEIFADAIESNFDEEGSAGKAWTPLAEATKRERERLGFGDAPILERTGDLRDAATSVRVAARDRAEVGLDPSHPYGAFHVQARPGGHLPRRDFLETSRETLEDVDEAVVAHLERHGG